MHDAFGRNLDYLRISVTDRCNFHCAYCRPHAGNALLSYDDLFRLSSLFVDLGVRHLRITGGEPLVREGVSDFIARLKGIPSLESIGITTNASLLQGKLPLLEKAGLDYLNISLDATDRELFHSLSGSGQRDVVLENTRQASRGPIHVKLNTVLLRSTWERQLDEVTAFAMENGIPVRFIELMPIGEGSALEGVPGREVEKELERRWGKGENVTVRGNGPAFYRRYQNGLVVGYIDAMTESYCKDCTRLRLLSDGRLKLCLHQKPSLSLKGLLKENDETIREAILKEIAHKQESHHFLQCPDGDEEMAGIGG